MEVKNLNQTKPNQTEPKWQATNSRQLQTNRQLGRIFPFLLSASYLWSIYARLCSRISTLRPSRRCISPYPPSPIWERENLGSLSSIFFWNFFWEIFFDFFWKFFLIFFAEFHKVLFCGCGYFWESAFFELSILMEKDSFFLQEWYLVR